MTRASFADRLERSNEASGPTVAERVFERDGQPRAVRVRIRKPRRDPETDNFWCTFEVLGLDEELSFKLWGIDSLQAFQLVLRAAGELLRERELGLTWCGDEYLGFPKTYPAFLPAAAHSKIERLIEREVEKASRSPRRKPRRR